MFGILYLLYCGILHIAANIQYEIKSLMTRHDSYDPDTGLSYGIYGETYDETFGGKQVIVTARNYGRVLVKDKKGRVLRDITQEKMNREYSRLKNKPNSIQTVVEWSMLDDEPNKADLKNADIPWGKRYKDVETGAIYVKRNFKCRGDIYKKQASKIKNLFNEYNKERYKNLLKKAHKYPVNDFYMDVDTGMLIRVVDNTYENFREKVKRQFKYSDAEIDTMVNASKEKDERWIELFNKKQMENLRSGMREINGNSFYCNSEVAL